MSVNVLFVGDAWLGSNARSMADGFALAGCRTVHVDTTAVSRPQKWSYSWFASRISGRRPRELQAEVLNAIGRARRDTRFDVAVCFKTIHIDQAELFAALEGIPLRVHYSADDVSNPYNTTSDYLAYESVWDLVVTTKRHNVPELLSRGVRDSLFVWSAYDPHWHYPSPLRSSSRFVAGFIGNRRPDRERLVVDLARRYGSEFRVDGPGWVANTSLKRSGAVVGRGAYAQSFSESVASAMANLLLLNSENRDAHTCRTFEIPAAGGLVVGARTDEHSELLEEGLEALYFDSEDELLAHIEWVRRNRSTAEAIAERGRVAIEAGHHTYEDRAREILRHLGCL